MCGVVFALTVNLFSGNFVIRNNSGNAGGSDMVYGKLISATARRGASIS